MRTNTQEALLSAYIVSIGKRTPRDAAQLLKTPPNLQIRELAQSPGRNRLQERPHGAARATEAKPTNPD
jgi:hypothetical protein